MTSFIRLKELLSSLSLNSEVLLSVGYISSVFKDEMGGIEILYSDTGCIESWSNSTLDITDAMAKAVARLALEKLLSEENKKRMFLTLNRFDSKTKLIMCIDHIVEITSDNKYSIIQTTNSKQKVRHSFTEVCQMLVSAGCCIENVKSSITK